MVLTLVLVTDLGAQSRQRDVFSDITSQAGVEFRHQDGRSGQKFYVETTASGGGWLDFDGDGDLDIYLINGAATPGSKLAGAPLNALFENREGRFVDVAAQAGVADDGYGMGLCVGDFDADGQLDFLVTNHGVDRLYRSSGGGRFVDVAGSAGVAHESWSGSCAFGDLDGDGDLDLYVTHYVDFAYERNPKCGTPGNLQYCRPNAFRGLPDSLYLNRGDGTFMEVGAKRGIQQSSDEKGMGVVLTDLDADGDLDIYVANDGAVNRLYVNRGDGHFEDQGLISGAGLNALGAPEAGMGVAIGDLGGDGLFDLLITHFAMETHTLYRQQKSSELQFEDVTSRAGFGPDSYRMVGWGVGLLDFDNDGDLDFAVANGHMQDEVERLEPGLRYRQPNQLFENQGGRFKLRQEPSMARETVSRGLAVGDWNNDGWPDLLVTNTNDRPELLENRGASATRGSSAAEGGHHWLGLRLVGPASNRFAIGTRVTVIAGDRRQVGEVRSGGGFQSQNDLRLLFGLGSHEGLVSVEIRWPDGQRQSLRVSELNRYQDVRYGTK